MPQHREHRCHADARREQHGGAPLTGVDREVARRRARLDDATLAGSYRALLRVRAGEAKLALQASPELQRATALRCCVEMALTELEALPTGTRATARYAFRLE